MASLTISAMAVALVEPTFTATRFADLIRFQAEGVVELRVQVYDLAETLLWDSGVNVGDIVDWNRHGSDGLRISNGLYVYHAQGWDATNALILDKTGKVVLLPGDQVQLQAAPAVGSQEPFGESGRDARFISPKAMDMTSYNNGDVGIGDIGTNDVGFRFTQDNNSFDWDFRRYDPQEGFSISKIGSGGPENLIMSSNGATYQQIGLNIGNGRLFMNKTTAESGSERRRPPKSSTCQATST